MDSVQDRLQRLEDLEEIRQLFIDYGHHLDVGDFEAYANLFAADGEVLLGVMGRAKGPQAIRTLMESQLGASVGQSYHLIANPIVRLDGDKAASFVTWVAILRDRQGNPSLRMWGHHKDVLIREQGHWKFLRREGHIDLPTKMPEAQ
jgi:uncharacterized protein (TIGR02246 family)